MITGVYSTWRTLESFINREMAELVDANKIEYQDEVN